MVNASKFTVQELYRIKKGTLCSGFWNSQQSNVYKIVLFEDWITITGHIQTKQNQNAAVISVANNGKWQCWKVPRRINIRHCDSEKCSYP